MATTIAMSPDRQLAREGFVRLGRLIGGRRIRALRAALDRLVPDARPDGPYGVLRHDPWRTEPAFAEALEDGTLATAARRLLGAPQVVLFQDHVVWKPPGTTDAVQWHQDRSYWPLDAPRGVTLWVALDEANEDNGCLRYVTGTHLLGPRRPADFVVGANRGGTDDLPAIDLDDREADVVAVPCDAGEVLAHHPDVWHSSPANTSDRHRRAWSLTFVTPDARWAPDRAPHPYLYELSPRPGTPLDPVRFPHHPEVAP